MPGQYGCALLNLSCHIVIACFHEAIMALHVVICVAIWTDNGQLYVAMNPAKMYLT